MASSDLKLIPPEAWGERRNSPSVKQIAEKQFSSLRFSCEKARYEEHSESNALNHFKNCHISLTLRTHHSVLVSKVILLSQGSQKVSYPMQGLDSFFHAFSFFFSISNLSSLQQVIFFPFVGFLPRNQLDKAGVAEGGLNAIRQSKIFPSR